MRRSYRRTLGFLLTGCVAVMGCANGNHDAATSPETPPNIVYLYADDLAARGRSLMDLVTASCGQMQGSLTQAMLVASSRKANAADAHKSP